MIRHLIRIVLELLWRDYQHVGVFKTDTKTLDWRKDKIEVWIHCYESRWGTRRIKIMICRPGYIDILNCFMARRIRRAELYQTELLPWLHGRRHGKIPSYQKVKGGKWDFLKKLKGETSVVLNDDEK